jgi:ATP-binding cassette subfamily C (CFTR/MRP) protein 1
MEHFRSRAPSMLVICYAFLKGLLSAVSRRSYDHLGVLPTLGVLSALLTALYLLLMCVELVEKRGLLRQKVRML